MPKAGETPEQGSNPLLGFGRIYARHGDDCTCVVFDRIDEAVLSRDKQQPIRAVLTWYKEKHPNWFRWLSMR